jgi:hypothetical protein
MKTKIQRIQKMQILFQNSKIVGKEKYRSQEREKQGRREESERREIKEKSKVRHIRNHREETHQTQAHTPYGRCFLLFINQQIQYIYICRTFLCIMLPLWQNPYTYTQLFNLQKVCFPSKLAKDSVIPSAYVIQCYSHESL